MHHLPRSSYLPRRDVLRVAFAGAATFGVGALTTASSANPTALQPFPQEFSYPLPDGPSLALWGSSSIEGAHCHDGVPPFWHTRLDQQLQNSLGIPVYNFGRGGETSSNIAARRGVAQNLTSLIFEYEEIPASGSAIVKLDKKCGNDWNKYTRFPGYVQTIPAVLSATGQKPGYYSFSRMDEGTTQSAPRQSNLAEFHSYQAMISQSSHHLIQVGRNNLLELERIVADTQACFEMAPDKSIVMGHFEALHDAPSSPRSCAVRKYNAWGLKTFGERFMNPQEWIRENSRQSWLSEHDLAGSSLWQRSTDQKDFDLSKIPGSLYANDGFHLNGWGYLALGRMIEQKITDLAWFTH